ncbi:DUF58 domain-containing protein [Xylanimonas protaetiae]|uniref:DUF58 domain-containing protein n=1 Tax=Xylanimonas protaetiae TaxID=2509457 RepID=A0A4P6FH50_9MICO|nr:DUF58 domain-containing protein [Xylanimonas protaetiae]QAY69948.1 DUF58 domain-containing protein [Xylanimonas protaetiae]
MSEGVRASRLRTGRRALPAPFARVLGRAAAPARSARRAGGVLAAAARRGWEPVGAVVSPYGVAAVVVALAAWAAGLAYSWLEVLVVAVLLTASLAAAVVFVLGTFRYTVDLGLATRRVTVGDRAVGRLVVGNASARALLPSVMEVPVGLGSAAFPVPRLRPGAEHEEVFTIPTRRRSVIVVGPVRSVRADPLGLLRRAVTWSQPQELFVHPVVKSLAGSSTGFLKDLEGRATQDISSSDVSFHALRDYVPGDDRRHIHWKTTARTGQLMVRQFEETRRSHLAVMLSTRTADYADGEEFELAVSVCGSLGLQAIKEDRGVTVLVNSGSLRGDHRTRLLDDLARVELSPSKARLADVARVAAATVADASVVAFVVGSGVPPAELRAASARLPQDVSVMALQCVPGAVMSKHSIAELTVLTLGSLGELPLAMRRLADA